MKKKGLKTSLKFSFNVNDIDNEMPELNIDIPFNEKSKKKNTININKKRIKRDASLNKNLF